MPTYLFKDKKELIFRLPKQRGMVAQILRLRARPTGDGTDTADGEGAVLLDDNCCVSSFSIFSFFPPETNVYTDAGWYLQIM